MSIVCPHCRHGMTIKDPKPGKYKPKCSKCGERFDLEISSDPAKAPKVSKGKANLMETVLADDEQMAMIAGTGNTDVTLAPGLHATTVKEDTRSATVKTIPQRAMDQTAPLITSNVTKADLAGAVPLPPGTPSTIGGYKILRELGRGAMGSVYLARQNSLNREVALKTIQPQYVANPAFIARFTREAYAAAQLSHHNVVQIYDLGQDGEQQFFSMEFIRGCSLDELIKREGKLDERVAVGYVLQAARGLQFAHNQGMVHRDVKPANLMLSELGVVKVTDLGLVKTPELAKQLDEAEAAMAGGDAAGKSASQLAASTAQITHVNIAMGTPAYMAPEQATNAAGVDHRADIYALGCTLYVMLTGRPPFEGASALEVITKHKTEPVVRPEALVKRISPALSEITLKLVAKKPEERYANMGEVIKAFESFLGIQSSGPFSPREEHAAVLETSLAKFNGAGVAKLRTVLPLALLLVCWLVGAALFLVNWGWATAMFALPVMAIAFGLLLGGLRERDVFLTGLRRWMFLASATDWLIRLAAGLILVVVLVATGWIWAWLGAGVVAVLCALAYQAIVRKPLATARAEPIQQMEDLLRGLRLRGVDEQALQQFVARYSSDHWEEMFEALFGYEAKLRAREQWGKNHKGQARPKFRGWCDGFLRYVENQELLQREARDRKHLQTVEEKNLQAQGLDLITARKQAQRVADALLDQAADARDQQTLVKPMTATIPDPAALARLKRAKMKQMLSDAKAGKHEPRRSKLLATAFSPLTLAFGPQVRFLIGCALLLGCALWARQNNLLSGERIKEATAVVKSSVEAGNATALQNAAAASEGTTQALALPAVGPFFDSFVPGVAGLLLLVAGFFGGWRMSIFVLPAAAIMVLGPALGMPGIAAIGGSHTTSLVIGLALGAVGLVFGRTYDDVSYLDQKNR